MSRKPELPKKASIVGFAPMLAGKFSMQVHCEQGDVDVPVDEDALFSLNEGEPLVIGDTHYELDKDGYEKIAAQILDVG